MFSILDGGFDSWSFGRCSQNFVTWSLGWPVLNPVAGNFVLSLSIFSFCYCKFSFFKDYAVCSSLSLSSAFASVISFSLYLHILTLLR